MSDPTPTPPTNWYTRQPVAVQLIISGLVGVLLNLISQWGITPLRPPAPDLLPSAPAAIQAAQGAKAAAVLTDVGLLE